FINLGAVVAYFGLLRLLEFPTFTATFAYSQISSGISGARRILELINRETNLDQNAEGRVEPIKGEVEFRNVSFDYHPQPLPSSNGRGASEGQGEGDSVLQNISFKVKPG